jgi:hypothetical protein
VTSKRVCFVLPFASVDRAIEATDFLYGNELWVQRFGELVAVYVPPGQQPPRIEKAALHALRDGGMGDQVLGEIRRLVWDARAECFVDPDDPGVDGILGTLIEDPEFDAVDSKWTVTVRPRSIFVHRAARGQLVALRRPLLEATGEHYVLGARDGADAESIAAAALALDDVGGATTARLTWLDRWRLRQQFAGNYGVQDPAVPYATGPDFSL